MHQVDELLEHRPLAVAVVRPDGSIAPNGALSQQQAEEKVQALRRLPERIALDIEDHVPVRRPRQELESAARVALDRMPIQSPGLTPLDLQRRLIAQRLERMRRHLRHVGFRRGPGERRHRRQSGVAQSHHLRVAHTRHLHEMVVGDPA